MEKLLTRDDFRSAVFARDGYKCVNCGITAGDVIGSHPVRLDAHHILERRLFSDGGYYLSNGATLCDQSGIGCHMDAETTALSVEDIRLKAGITKVILPEDMYADLVYDKWGNTILANGTRTRGPLFNDASVQKVLALNLHLFTDLVKYPAPITSRGPLASPMMTA